DALKTALPEGIRVEELPSEGEWTADQTRWSRRAVEIFKEVSVDESTGPHGERQITVSVADGAKALREVVFVRGSGSASFGVYLVTPTVFESLYAEGPPVLPPGELLKTANPELYQSLNPFFVVLFTPLLVAFFMWLTRRGKDFSTARKIFVGMVITMLSVLLMALAGFVSEDGTTKVTWWWLVGFFAIVTVGELCLSPMALSLVTKLSPARFTGLTMGGWFFATAVGNKFSGFLGGLQSSMDPTPFFLVIAAAVGVVALFLYLLLPKLDAAIKQYGA
ncbi:MAG: hypothetical protein QF412_07005, partial [Planctomycetota bacterium]|nr:hypothetical protein [Planctomycetota bacterium]